jgi:hypothetical protein
MVLARWEGCDRQEIAEQEKVSGETVRLETVEVRKCVVEDFRKGA